MFAVPVGKVHNAQSLAEWHVKKHLILRGRKWKTSAQEHERYQTIQHRARAKSIGKRSKNTPSNLSSCLFTGSSSGNLRSLPYIYIYTHDSICIHMHPIILRLEYGMIRIIPNFEMIFPKSPYSTYSRMTMCLYILCFMLHWNRKNTFLSCHKL